MSGGTQTAGCGHSQWLPQAHYSGSTVASEMVIKPGCSWPTYSSPVEGWRYRTCRAGSGGCRTGGRICAAPSLILYMHR